MTVKIKDILGGSKVKSDKGEFYIGFGHNGFYPTYKTKDDYNYYTAAHRHTIEKEKDFGPVGMIRGFVEVEVLDGRLKKDDEY